MKRVTYKYFTLLGLFLFFAVKLNAENGKAVIFSDLSLQLAQKKAQEENKFLFIDFYAQWSAPSKQMEKSVFMHPVVADYMNEHYISVRIDVDKADPALLQGLQVRQLPTTVIYNSSGELVFNDEGLMYAAEFMALAMDMRNLKEYADKYKKNDNRTQNVLAYAQALNWINPERARYITLKYLKRLPEKKYADEDNWKLISLFVIGKDRPLFPRVLQNNELLQAYGKEYKNYMNKRLDELLQMAIAEKHFKWLDLYKKYLKTYPVYFNNADSISLAGHLAFAREHDTPNLSDLLRDYTEKYFDTSPQGLSKLALNMSQEYFKKDILSYALELADQSLSHQPSAEAYLAKAIAYNKMNESKEAYAYLLLAYKGASEAMLDLIIKMEPQIQQKLSGELKEGVNTAFDKEGLQDGRFTLGAGKKRLMYGYPIPKSTSHFIIKINDKIASNATHFGSDVHRLKGKISYEGKSSTPRVRTTYQYENIRIIQLLTPVDVNGIEIIDGLAHFYKISYSFQNLEYKAKEIGLAILFDTMIDDNDACTIETGKGRKIDLQRTFRDYSMPKSLLFYRTENDTTDMMGSALISGFEATPPDELTVGAWPYLHHVIWEVKSEKIHYGDSGFFIKWEKDLLSGNGAKEYVVYYGLPKHKSPELKLVMEDEQMLTMTETIYFENENAGLDLNAKMKISQLLEDKNIVISGVLLNGYTDITGGGDYNFKLSQKRIENVGKIFEAHGIPYVPKPYGIQESESNTFNERYGNAWDRKVEIVVYYKSKNLQ